MATGTTADTLVIWTPGRPHGEKPQATGAELSAPAAQRSSLRADHQGGVMWIAYSPDGRRIAAGTWTKEVFIWDGGPVDARFP